MAKLSLKNIWNKQTIFLLCVLLFALIYCCFRMSNASYFGKPLLEGNHDDDKNKNKNKNKNKGKNKNKSKNKNKNKNKNNNNNDGAAGGGAATELTANDLDAKLSAIQGDTTPTGVYLGNYQLRKTNNANLGQIQGSNQSNHQTFPNF